MSVPPWRRLSPDSGAARLWAAVGGLAALASIGGLIVLPLWTMLDDARARAARLDERAAALTAAATDRRAEAATASLDETSLAAANAWLEEHAPVRADDAAMLDLISTLRLIAQTAEVELASAAPLRQRGEADLFFAADMAGLSVSLAEARIVADHAGLARFLAAVEAARPTLRAAALEITARSSAAAAEDERLTAQVVVGALRRAKDLETGGTAGGASR